MIPITEKALGFSDGEFRVLRKLKRSIKIWNKIKLKTRWNPKLKIYK